MSFAIILNDDKLIFIFVNCLAQDSGTNDTDTDDQYEKDLEIDLEIV